MVGGNVCGIDVEHIRRIPDSIVNRMYSKEDAERIADIEDESEKADIYSTCVWTRREAFGKMTGTGLLMSDPDQKKVMDDGYMAERNAVLTNYEIGQYPSGKLFIINCKESVKAQFVVAVCSEKGASIADLHVIDSHKLEI